MRYKASKIAPASTAKAMMKAVGEIDRPRRMFIGGMIGASSNGFFPNNIIFNS
jgi:hypothetical protein